MSKVLVITTSLRAKSNSDILASRLAEGAKDAGHSVECVSLKGKEIKYCIGCLTCQKTQKCVIKDDVPAIAEKVKNAETVVTRPIINSAMSICSQPPPRTKILSPKERSADCRAGLTALKKLNSPALFSAAASLPRARRRVKKKPLMTLMNSGGISDNG